MNTEALLSWIDEKGSLLAQKLGVAVEFLYEKILLYVRVKGAIQFFTAIICVISFIVFAKIAANILKKNQEKREIEKKENNFDYSIVGDDWFSGYFIAFLICVTAATFVGIFAKELVESGAMIFAPEYYLIDQAIERFSE